MSTIAELSLTPEDLLAGATAIFDVPIPPDVLRPGEGLQQEAGDPAQERVVRLRPLTIGVFQLILRATQNDPGLIPLLMIKESFCL